MAWRSCHLRRQKILADALSCLQLPASYPLEKGMPHTLLWAGLCSTTSHPHPTYRHTNGGEMGAGTQLAKLCLPSRNSSQECSGFRKEWQKRLGKGRSKGPGSRSQERGCKLGISGHSYHQDLEPKFLTPLWPFTEQLPSGRWGKELEDDPFR